MIKNKKAENIKLAVLNYGTVNWELNVIKKHELEPPAMIVVGEVVSLREFLKWMD